MLDWRGEGTVLVVDDEEHVRSITELMLSQFGLDVLTAEDGPTALQLLDQHGEAIDLVIMDLTMPKMSGEQTYREMLSRQPTLRTLLTSGYNETDATFRHERGIVGFLQKPFEIEQLLDVIRQELTSA